MASHCVVAWAIIVAEITLIMFPLVRYLTIGWYAKRRDIMDGLGPDARLAYFQMFCRNEDPPPEKDVCEAFEQLYEKWYGRRFFIVPGLLLFGIVLLGTTAATFSGLALISYVKNPFASMPSPAIAAFAGSYFWAANDLISRARRLDFAPSDLMWASLRFVISIPMAYAFFQLAKPVLATFIAFSLGSFPLDTIGAMLQRLTNRALNLQATDSETFDDIIKLQGINPTIVARLNAEDITTVVQLAYCDPVQLTMRSNLRFNFITDCMSQALAWMYLESRLGAIRVFGMRGACEIRELILAFDNPGTTPEEQNAHAQAVAAFPAIAAELAIDAQALQETFRQIGEDPFTAFLMRIWT